MATWASWGPRIFGEWVAWGRTGAPGREYLGSKGLTRGKQIVGLGLGRASPLEGAAFLLSVSLERASAFCSRRLYSLGLEADQVDSAELLSPPNQGIWLPESDHGEAKRCGRELQEVS